MIDLLLSPLAIVVLALMFGCSLVVDRIERKTGA